jgi:predicted component of viral defense system (DUF524 family)
MTMIELSDCGVIRFHPSADQPQPISARWQDAFAPAQWFLHEWAEYWLACPEAAEMHVGTCVLTPGPAGVFRLVFENQLGLVQITPYRDHSPLCASLYVEVVSPKFPTIEDHFAFYQGLLDDLFVRSSRFPFALDALTQRGVVEADVPPTLLFLLNVLAWHAQSLSAALATVRSTPHRKLVHDEAWVAIDQVTEIAPDDIVRALSAPETWQPTRGSAFAAHMGGVAPVRLWQRIPRETVDTPENRFVRHLLHELVRVIETLTQACWWPRIALERRQAIAAIHAAVHDMAQNSFFAEVGEMHRLPVVSRVLLQREGYRDLFVLWCQMQFAHQPFFTRLQQAMDLRDVATLYEVWCFFVLVAAIHEESAIAPVLTLPESDEYGLRWGACAVFPGCGTLHYNIPAPSYSVAMRPDFLWQGDDGTLVVLDAKFRMDVAIWDTAAHAKADDVVKMHAYRDALHTTAAICIYPGDQSIFYAADGRSRPTMPDLMAILQGRQAGVGALAWRPETILRG